MLSLMGQKKIATQIKFYTHQNVLQEQSLNKDIFRQTKSELSTHRTSLKKILKDILCVKGILTLMEGLR